MNNIQWIKSPVNNDGAAVTFSKKLKFEKSIRSVCFKISSVGVYKAVFNGKKLGTQVLTPGYTSYGKRIQYQTYEVKDNIPRENIIEITVAPGWAVGHLGYTGEKSFFADHVSAVARIDVLFEDGSVCTFRTDESWEVFTYPVVFADIYMGETFDALHTPAYLGNAVLDRVETTLIPQQGEDITEHEHIAPIELITTPKGERVIDFGQNMTGYVQFDVCGKKGERIVTTCAEVLDVDGNFYNDNYRLAQNRVTFILDGTRRIYKPEFSFQGFRYIRIEEYPDIPVELNCIRAIAVHSEMERIGRFKCGNERINQLYHNIIWGQKSNFLDVPTDCPQRDERLGWTGDAQVFCRTASMNFNTKKFYSKWLADLRADQTKEGAIWGVCPEWHGKHRPTRISAAWGDAAVIVPWEVYLAYGDVQILRDNFEMMKKWVEYIRNFGPEEFLWLGGYHYGDWLAMDAGGEGCVGATSNDLIATAFFANAIDIVIKAGSVLGEDVEAYRELYANVKAKFRDYFMENGMPKDELPFTEIPPAWKPNATIIDSIRLGITQTALVLILKFNLCLETERDALANKLEELIHEFGDRMSTGFVGTPYILHVLTECGKTELAYKLLFQDKNPSWLYSVDHGATTMWEHWNGIKEDGSFWADDMNSFNHYAYGSVGDWLYAVCAGISVCDDGAGYKKFLLRPHPDEKLGFVNCSVDTEKGKIESNWYYKKDTVYFEFSVPKGSIATIVLPNGFTETVCGGKYMYSCVAAKKSSEEIK